MQAVIDSLEPLLSTLVVMLESADEHDAAAFFEGIRSDLLQTTEEIDLLALFTFRLAAADEIVATYGLSGPPIDVLDLLLERATEIAATFTADDSQPH